MSKKHALLSASSAHRWLVCTPSARMEAQMEDTTSEYAAEGTLAHDIAELKVRQKYVKPQSKTTFNKKMKALKAKERYQPEMDSYTENYLDYVSETIYSFETAPHVAVEQRVDFSSIVPEGFGTCDCIVIGGDRLEIIDLKYGKGVQVDATDNPQLRLYALGAMEAYEMLYPITNVTMHIVQPRRGHISTETLTAADLKAWAQDIQPAVQAAYDGTGDYKPEEKACKFCRIRETCRARAEYYQQLAEQDFVLPPLLTAEEVGEVLKTAAGLQDWINDLKEWALEQSLAGTEVPGWKAVAGTARRTFKDREKAFKILIDSGIKEELLYERKPLSLASAEKLIGKKEFAELLADQIVIPLGKPTLVPENDKREKLAVQSAKEDFKEE